MGNPERDLPSVVQVVGTNGKGTTAVALAAAFEAMGRPAGAFLSPHVLSYTERVLLGGGRVSEADFATAMGQTIAIADRNGIPVSQFEILTAGALAMFAEAGLSLAVLEAGLGARYDATSVARPSAVVLTNVALDHTEYLGDTVEEIAEEKLASLTPGATLYLGTNDPRVANIARARCRLIGADLVDAAGSVGNTTSRDLPPYAASDVDLGLEVAESLLATSLPTDVRERITLAVRASLPGRFEVRELDGVPVVLDGGHNAAGVSAAFGAVRDTYRGRPLGVVFGVLHEKDVASMLSGFMDEAHAIVLTRPESERASDPAQVVRACDPIDRRGGRALVVQDPVQALGVAVETMRDVNGVVLVTGSLSTVAPVLGWLREE
jgi:dihydrofolate synthase/folylpolyglutamate synthase